jgi:hypothetical protein
MTLPVRPRARPNRRIGRLLRRLLPLLLGVAGCDLFTAPDLPPGAVSFDPPARYRLWWDMAQSCSGRTGRLRSIRWMQVPDATYLPGDGEPGRVTSRWYAHGNTIVLAGASVLEGEVVRHEMLHALLRVYGHPSAYFQARCGGVVSCGFSCRNEGGARAVVPSDAPVVPSEELRLELQVLPVTNTFATDSGATAVIVVATNPHDYAVRVRAMLGSFRVRIERQDGPEVLYGVAHGRAAGTDFGPGERRQYAFDFELPPGAYRVYGYFDDSPTDVVDYRVAP